MLLSDKSGVDETLLSEKSVKSSMFSKKKNSKHASYLELSSRPFNSLYDHHWNACSSRIPRSPCGKDFLLYPVRQRGRFPRRAEEITLVDLLYLNFGEREKRLCDGVGGEVGRAVIVGWRKMMVSPSIHHRFGLLRPNCRKRIVRRAFRCRSVWVCVFRRRARWNGRVWSLRVSAANRRWNKDAINHSG